MITTEQFYQILNDVKIEDVMNVYSGKAGKCCCGCSGKYWTASAHREIAEERRGYKLDEKDVSDRQVKRIFKLVMGLVSTVGPEAIDYQHGYLAVDDFSTSVEGRQYILYFVPSGDELKGLREMRAERDAKKKTAV